MTMKKYLKKRIIPAGLSLILIIMTVISIMPINVSAEDSLNVIEISRVNELIEFANKCKYDSYSKDKIVKLTADIDVSGSDFKGISYFFLIKATAALVAVLQAMTMALQS